MGLWEEGRGFCCLYPICPPSTTRSMPVWGEGWSTWISGTLGLGRGLTLDLRWGPGFRGTLFSHPCIILPTSLCLPRPPGPSSHIKLSLCQAGGREPRRVAGGGEKEVAHTAREHLEAFEGGPFNTALRSGVGH